MKSLSAVGRVIVLAVLILTSLPDHGLSQDRTAAGRVVGFVADRTGAGVPASTIAIRSLDVPREQLAITDRDGRYVFAALPPGRYTLSATAPGFETATREDFIVLPNLESVVDFTLDVARTLVTVEVTAPMGARPLSIETDPRTPRQPMPAHDGADYLKTIPGFSVIRKGGTDGDPVLRGMAGSRLGILLDGENVYGGCGNRMDPPTAYAFPEAYDRITVLKGPQTVLHGPGNSAGVVLFERDRPVERGVQLYASPTVGLFGRNDQVAELKAGGRLAFLRLAATRSAMGDYQDGTGDSVHSQYERWSTNATLGWTPDDATQIEVSGGYSDGEAAYADRLMDGVGFARQHVGVRAEHRDIAPVVRSLEGHAFYNYVDHVMDNYTLRAFVPSMMMPGRSVSNPDRRTAGGRIASALQFSGATAGTLGVDWQGNRHSVRGSSNQTVDPFEDHARVRDAAFDNLGVFAELTQGFGARQRFVAGARFDRWTGRDHRRAVALGMGSTAANPTSGLRRQEHLGSGFGRYEVDLTAAATVYAGVGHAGRAPDYWELVSKESRDSLSAFETRPERTTQLDAGLLYRRGAVSGSLSMFASDISDFILIQSNYAKTMPGSMGTTMGGMASAAASRLATITRNIDASTWGGEASLAWSLTARVKLDTSVAYVRGENDTDGRPLAQLPPLEARIGLQYATARASIGGLTRLVAAQDRYALNQGNIVGQDLGPTAGFAIVALNGGWRLHRVARLAAGVDNLLDATYAEFISRSGASVPGFTTTRRVNEPGRTLWIKLELRR